MKNTLSTWDPFYELDHLRRLFTPGTGNDESASWVPAVDIVEDENEYLVKADLPEVKKEDLSVTFEKGILTISGERKFEKETKDEKKKYHRVERSYGKYSRSFQLPETVDAEQLTADFKDGVLVVHLPKHEEIEPKSIRVNVE